MKKLSSTEAELKKVFLIKKVCNTKQRKWTCKMQIYTRIFPMVKFCQIVEAVAQRCSVKKVFVEISQIHRKAPVPESLF